ncbi:MAG: signal peptidase I [Mogibacterium sp.]|nr:signal peptidase I [Mogibacterium sp.]
MNNATELRQAVRTRKKRAELWNLIWATTAKAVGFTALVLFAFSRIFGVLIVQGNDMFPTLCDGDIVLYYRTGDLTASDVAVFETEDGTVRCGRIRAKSGAVISRTGDGQLTVDGTFQPVQPRAGIFEVTYAGDHLTEPLTLRDGEFFVLNDNRGRDTDSRTFGPVPMERVIGRACAVMRSRTI